MAQSREERALPSPPSPVKAPQTPPPDTEPSGDLPPNNPPIDFSGWTHTHYLESHEVSITAVPLREWSLSLERLPPQRVVQLRLKLYVSLDGRIDHFEVLDSSLSGTETQSLLADLASTPLAPAKLDTSPVPSVKYIEFGIDTRTNSTPVQP